MDRLGSDLNDIRFGSALIKKNMTTCLCSKRVVDAFFIVDTFCIPQTPQPRQSHRLAAKPSNSEVQSQPRSKVLREAGKKDGHDEDVYKALEDAGGRCL